MTDQQAIQFVQACPSCIVVGIDPGASEGSASAMRHPIRGNDIRGALVGRWAWKGGKATMERGGLAEAIKTYRHAARAILDAARRECEGRVMVRVEGTYLDRDKPKGVLGPTITGGLWLSLAFPATFYEMPKPAQWRKWHGFNTAPDPKQAAVDFARLVLGLRMSTHDAEAFCMSVIPPTAVLVENNPRRRRKR